MPGIKFGRLGKAGHVVRMEEEETSRNVLVENSTTKISRKTKNKLGGRCPEGCITGPRNTKLEETSWECKRMEAPFGEGQNLRGALALYKDGWVHTRP